MARTDTSYEQKDKIINLYNTSVSHYNASCLGSADDASNQEDLCVAGERLYCCFEAAIKHVLVNYWRSQYQQGVITYPEFDRPGKNSVAKKQVIEDAKRPWLVARLKELLSSGKITPLCSLVVDYTIIETNAKKVTNANKHCAKNVDRKAYLASLTEIKRFILSFIQLDAKLLKEDENGGAISQQALRLLEKWNYLEPNPAWNYVLVVDSVSNMTEAQQQAIASVNWALVMDTDPSTCEHGLVRAFEKLRGIQPERFQLDHPERTDFYEFCESPYWYFLNGRSSIPESLNDGSIRNWRQKNGYFRRAIEKYHSKFPKNVRILVFSKQSLIVSDILRDFDTCYDEKQLIFTSDTHQGIAEDYTDSEMMLMELDDLARTILANGSRFKLERQNGDTYMPSNQGMVSVVPQQYSHLELVHKNLADPDKVTPDEKDPVQFYRGSMKLSWFGAHQGFDVERTTSFNQLAKRISALENRGDKLIVEHQPGSGGTTFMRSFAYRKRTEYPTIILRQYSKDETARQIKNLYAELRMQILILADEFDLSMQQIDALHKELKSESFPFVIVYSKRGSSKSHNLSISNLDDLQFDEMLRKLKAYVSVDRVRKLESLKNRNGIYRTPFFLSLTAFDEDFTGIEPFIRRFLSDKVITEEQKRMLTYISLADRYASRHISVDTFPSVMKLLEPLTDANVGTYSPLEELVVIEPGVGAATSTYCIRHVRFAEEIIRQRLLTNPAGEDITGAEKAGNLVECLIQLIHDSKNNIAVDYDITLDLLRNMFIERDRSALNRDRFSPIITKIKNYSDCEGAGDAGSTRVGRIFKELVSTYPDDPHFKAHLSRYYTYVEENYNKGVDTALDAILSQSYQTTSEDPILYHIYGISLSKRISNQIMPQIEANEISFDIGLDNLLTDARDALDAFEWSIDSSSPDAGYYASISLCIDILDFAKRKYGCTSADELYNLTTNEEDQWYLEFLDEATELLEEWKAEDDSDMDCLSEENNEEASQAANRPSILTEKMKLTGRLNDFYGDINSLERTIDMWNKALARAGDSDIALRRRLLAQAKQRRLREIGYADATPQEIDEIRQLAESNIRMEPSNGANIRIWFEAARHCKSMNPEKLLDYAIDKLDQWRQTTGKMEAYFYHFVCVCIKAYEGDSRSQAAIPSLQQELQQKAEGRSDRRNIHEWLGKGKGLQRLIRFRGLPIPEHDLNNLEVLSGTVSVFKNPLNATVLSKGMKVFINPSRAKNKLGKSIEGKSVQLSIGFSYDGIRAYDQTVTEAIDIFRAVSEASEAVHEVTIGKRVKCRVVGRSEYHVQVKLVDFSAQEGSIHNSKLSGDYTVDNRPGKDECFYATVIGEKKGKYWQLSMLEADAEQFMKSPKWELINGKYTKPF